MTSSWAGLLPKVETQAADFVARCPLFNGSGVIVGILDTGVSPGAIGLKETPDGKQKIIDIVDCSGSGDVSMSGWKTAVNGEIVGSGGKILKINPLWENPTGKFRVGVKKAFELYPKDLKERVKGERKKIWLNKQKEAELEIRKQISSANGDKITDLKTRLDILKSFETDYDDIGPVYDCLVYHDGTHWNAVVDTTETGDMSNLTPMKDYHINFQFARFSDLDALVYSVNIFDDGTILSIVTDAGAHGSHVAGIVAAYHPDHPECNGIAPGAQIVSLKIGDTRLGSMETGVGLCRGLIEAVRRGCHIVNMSYGEAVAWDNTGRFVRLAEEIVNKHGIIFVSSAGNNGPAISTVGCPGGTSSSIIGVAALATQSLMSPAYSMTQVLPATNYTWSSVGPSLDGHRGVSIIAPGGAVTSVPNWTLSKNQLMNGTSMSSPNACGCIALLLSAAKQSSLPITPHRIRMAIENTAKNLPDVDTLGQGHGLIQVTRSWEYLQAHSDDASLDVAIQVSVLSDRFDRGIYLRQSSETSQADTYKVTVEPKFHENTNPDVKINYEVRVALKATVSWITCPEKLLLVTSGKTISIHVDPRELSVGDIHVGFVYGYDENRLEKGAIFEIPVTVMKPEVILSGVTSYSSGVLDLQPAERVRKFIVPPPGCAFIDLVLRDCRTLTHADSVSSKLSPDNIESSGEQQVEGGGDGDGGEDRSGRQVVVHALQLYRGTPYRDNEKDSYFMLTPGSEHTNMSWAVQAGVTMELTVARFWSTVGSTLCSYTLNFRGVDVVPQSLVITGGQRVSEIVRLFANLSTCDISPSGKLDKWIAVIKPNSIGKVTTLGERDILLDGTPIYQMILEYDLDQSEGGDVTPRWPGLNGVLYESEFMAQFFMIYDSRMKLMGTGDAWPSSIKLGKGKYTIRLQIKHENSSILEGVNDLPMHCERSMKSPISLSFHKSQAEAVSNGPKFSNRALLQGTSCSLHIKEPPANLLPKQASAGDFLLGSVTFLKKLNGSGGNGTRPGGYPIRYLIADVRSTNSSSSSSNGNSATPSSKPSTDVLEGLNNCIRDAKLKHLKGFVGADETFTTLLTSLQTDYPNYLPLHQIILSHANKLVSLNPSIEAYDRVITAASSVIALVDKDSVARTLGVNADKDDAESMSRRKESESLKSALTESLSSQALAIHEKMVLLQKSEIIEVPVVTAKSVSSSMALEPHAVVEMKVSEEPMVVPASSNTETPETAVVIESEILPTATVAGNNRVDISTTSVSECLEAFYAVLKELQKWEDILAEKYWLLYVLNNFTLSRYGPALNRIKDLIAGGKEVVFKDRLFELRDQCFKHMGWLHIYNDSVKATRLSIKDSFDPF